MSPLTVTGGSPRIPAGERGFSLLETMVAVVVFTIAALALALAMSQGTRSVTDSGQHTRASSVASQRTESLLTAAHTDSLLTAGSHSDPLNPYPGSYFATWLVENNTPVTNCKRITLEVRRGSTTAPVLVRTVVISSAIGG